MIEKHLTTHGYCKQKEGIWLKPVGSHLLVWKDNEWFNYFQSKVNGETYCYSSESYKSEDWDDDLVQFLKHCEMNTTLNMGNIASDFRVKIIESVLG